MKIPWSFLIAFLVAPAMAESVANFLEKKDQQILDLYVANGKNAEKTRVLLAEIIDAEAFAQRCLTNQWQKLTIEQRRESTKLLGDLFTAGHLRILVRFGKSKRIYKEIGAGNPKVIRVSAMANPSGKKSENFSIEYKLTTASGRSRIFDRLEDGVSMIESHQRQVDKASREGGFSAVKALIEKNLARQK